MGSPCLECSAKEIERRGVRLVPARLGGSLAFPERKIMQSGIGDSNPGRLVGSQESCRWTNPATSFTIERKERESNPQGSSLV